jgi:hypothetical protein
MRLTKGGKNTLYFDGRKMAARFTGTTKDVIYRAVKRLVDAGWLRALNGQGKKSHKSTGQYEATQYQVLTHDQWIAKHGTKKCVQNDEDDPVAPVRTEPVSPLRTASRNAENGQSQNSECPVAPARHSSVTHSSMTSSSMKANSMDSLSSSIGARLVSAGKRPKEEEFQMMQERPETPRTTPVAPVRTEVSR